MRNDAAADDDVVAAAVVVDVVVVDVVVVVVVVHVVAVLEGLSLILCVSHVLVELVLVAWIVMLNQ